MAKTRTKSTIQGIMIIQYSNLAVFVFDNKEDYYMNRSSNTQCRPSHSTKQKQLKRANTNSRIAFKTILKSRGSNQIVIEDASGHKQSPLTQPDESHQRRDQLRVSDASPVYRTNRNQQDKCRDGKEQRIATVMNLMREQAQCSKSQSQPKLVGHKKSIEDLQVFSPLMTLEELLKRAEELVEIKLSKKTGKSNIWQLGGQEDELEKELQQLVEHIQECCTAQGDDAAIREICQKIIIFDKIIASSYSESEMLKKFYFMRRFARKPFSLLDNKIVRETSSGEAAFNKHSNFTIQYPSMHFSTMSQTSFAKPHPDSYKKQYSGPCSYVPNRQILGRSSYQCDYLNYGSLPTYLQVHQRESGLSTLSFSNPKHSVYQKDFKQSKIQLVDSQDLDCRRDKYKPTKISFMPKKMLQAKENEREPKRMKRASKHKMVYGNNSGSYSSFYREATQMGSSGWCSSSPSMKTEYSSCFKGEKALLDCLQKDSGLSNLKYEYKKSANA